MKGPCKDCKERHFKCHSSCEKYKKFLEEAKKEKEWEKEQSRFISHFDNEYFNNLSVQRMRGSKKK